MDDARSEQSLPRGTNLSDVLTYRKVAIAVAGGYLGLEDAFLDAVLADRMEEYLAAQECARAAYRERDYPGYISLLARETVARYAATAAEGLAAPPGSCPVRGRGLGDTGLLGLSDDVNAVVRVQEMLAPMTIPSADGAGDEDSQAETIRLIALRHLCDYYNAFANALVRGVLLEPVMDAVEACLRGQGGPPLTAAYVRRLLDARGIVPPPALC